MLGGEMTIFKKKLLAQNFKSREHYSFLDSKILRTCDKWVGCIKLHHALCWPCLPRQGYHV